ncbi:unnamed protein product [Protopolystoma xenopodis]|uniref:Uncharacterized protein n=1 Tax=Protopolystoma xenopodis TaxID=117903 RepID=A0A448XE80_9PLAT|nr:unnamed protein product [Protopolystoma xenopodis]
MDTERSELAELIAQTGHEINWKATERSGSYGDNRRKRKIREAVDIVWEKNVMNSRLEEGRVSDNFANSGKTRMEQDQQKGDAWIKGLAK